MRAALTGRQEAPARARGTGAATEFPLATQAAPRGQHSPGEATHQPRNTAARVTPKNARTWSADETAGGRGKCPWGAPGLRDVQGPAAGREGRPQSSRPVRDPERKMGRSGSRGRRASGSVVQRVGSARRSSLSGALIAKPKPASRDGEKSPAHATVKVGHLTSSR